MLMQNNIGVEQVYYNPSSTATQPENYSLYVILAEDGSLDLFLCFSFALTAPTTA